MQVRFDMMNGENMLSMVPETHAELQALLMAYSHEAYCPDCEAALDDTAENLCPTCGEGIGMEPEFVKTRKKT